VNPFVTPDDQVVDVQASAGAGERITLSMAATGGIQASAESRTLGGLVVRYGVPGRTTRGLLRVRKGALRFPEDLGEVKLTKEHDRDNSRGHLRAVEFLEDGIRASAKVADGPEGDDALREAQDRTRDALSFDVIDATLVGDEIIDGRVIALGQVGIPAYDDSRIDQVAASHQGERMKLSPDQAVIFADLSAKSELSDEEKEVLSALKKLAAAPEVATPAAPAEVPVQASTTPPAAAAPAATVEVAASMPTVPSSVPTPNGSSTSAIPQGGAFGKFCVDMAAALNPDNTTKLADVQAALSDITYSAHQDVIQQPAWSGELWSGLEYEPEFLDLFTTGDMSSLKGEGWRFTNKMEIKDYAGDKAEIPTDTIGTESQAWAGARMAVGVDIDRAFFDFPTPGFIESLFQQVRESWKIKLDAKVHAYILAQAVAAAEDEFAAVPVLIGTESSLLRAAAVAVRAVKRRRLGKASWVLVSDEDLFTLVDTQVQEVLAYLKLFGIAPEDFRSSAALAPGIVYAGAKQAAKVRTLPGSPIRVHAQHLANGGIDQAFFGYWAIEEQHTKGIAKMDWEEPAP
jgi:hypothetical protein